MFTYVSWLQRNFIHYSIADAHQSGTTDIQLKLVIRRFCSYAYLITGFDAFVNSYLTR